MELMEQAGAVVDRSLAGEDMSEVLSAFARLAVEHSSGHAAWVILERDEQRYVAACPEHPAAQPAFLRSAELETRMARRPVLRGGREGGPPYVSVPVRLGPEHLGCLVIALEPGANHLDEETKPLAGLASLIGVAFRSRQVQRDRRQAQTETVRALTNALRARDEETAGESQRVAGLARELALELGYDPKSDETHDLYHGALLHDIGKLGVPESVLDKAEPLTDAEWATMRLHPGVAMQILDDITFLEGAARLIYACRERWDGKGYPEGLAGEEIPLAARIFAVADAWEAMTSPRAYGPALTPEEAEAEVRANAGARFDPQVVQAFERLAPVWAAEALRRRQAA
jgi:putative two-component system response regulator